MEFPFQLDFPYELLIAMYVVAISTTGYAVWSPIRRVNE
jgi:hypothetical protein